MLRKLKNKSTSNITVAVQGFNMDTDFIEVKAGKEVWVNEVQYKTFLTPQKDAKGFLVHNAGLVLSPLFEVVATDPNNIFVEQLEVTVAAGGADVTVAHNAGETGISVAFPADAADYEVKSVTSANVVIGLKAEAIAPVGEVKFNVAILK